MSSATDNQISSNPYALHKAVFDNDIKAVSRLIKSTYLGDKDLHGNTPLHLAVMLGHKGISERPGPVPLLSRILPSDVCRIYKRGSCLRMDTTLIDFNEKSWERGDISFIFDSRAKAGESLIILDNKVKVFQKVKYEASEAEIEDEVDILMSSDIVNAQMSTKSIHFTRSQSGWIFKHDRSEMVGHFNSDYYSLDGLVLISRKRREHLTSEDVAKNRALIQSFQMGAIDSTNIDGKFARRRSLVPPVKSSVSWSEYVNSEPGSPPILGRLPVVKRTIKQFRANVAMSKEFPLSVTDLLDILEIIAPFKHLRKLRDFCKFKLPPGFPVKIGTAQCMMYSAA